jgi:hypothetical protein
MRETAAEIRRAVRVGCKRRMGGKSHLNSRLAIVEPAYTATLFWFTKLNVGEQQAIPVNRRCLNEPDTQLYCRSI